MLEYRYDTQLLIDGHDLDEDKIYDYFVDNFEGDCLIAVGDEEMIKIHYHTNQPWKVLEYCASLGEIYDIVVEDRDRQSRGMTEGLKRKAGNPRTSGSWWGSGRRPDRSRPINRGEKQWHLRWV